MTCCAATAVHFKEFRCRGRIHRNLIVALTLSCVLVHAAYAATVSECEEKLAPALKGALVAKFPNFRIPTVSELDTENIGLNEQNGRGRCYAVATGDFAGKHQDDAAILLTSTGNDVRLIAAIRESPARWAIYELPTFCQSLRSCYVTTTGPGKFERTLAIQGPTHGIEREKLASKHMSVVSGTWESTAIVYVYDKAAWRYVWVSD